MGRPKVNRQLSVPGDGDREPVGTSGEIPVTIRDVAARAGVALSSVSRVLSGHPDVSAAMRSRVESAAKDLGYEPDLLAQSLRRGSTRTVGFVLRDISNPLFANIARRCEQELRRAGYSMVLVNSDGLVEAESEHLALLRRRRVDGVIASLVSETSASTRRALVGLRVPVV
ncbi:LacI family DNA-binding transcriptional regulator, partial [Micromonospora echinofusca]